MPNHAFKIRSRKFVKEDDLSYTFASSKNGMKNPFSIPKSQILKFEELEIINTHTKKNESWIEIIVTEWIWNHLKIGEKLKRYLSTSVAIIEGETHFGVNWDYVIAKRKDTKHCYFCHGKLQKANRTVDHLISRSILRIYGHKGGLHNNTVPCCYDCNQEKGSHHLEIYKEFAKRMISETGNPKYRMVMFTLNRTLKIN